MTVLDDLRVLDKLLEKSAEQIENDIKRLIYEDLQNLRFARDAWEQAHQMAKRLKKCAELLTILKAAPTQKNVDLLCAELKGIGYEIRAIQADIKKSISLEVLEKNEAVRATTLLMTITEKIGEEFSMIRRKYNLNYMF